MEMRVKIDKCNTLLPIAKDGSDNAEPNLLMASVRCWRRDHFITSTSHSSMVVGRQIRLDQTARGPHGIPIAILSST